MEVERARHSQLPCTRTQESSREEAHAKEVIDVALSHIMFPMAGTPNPCNKISYHFATGNERMQLASWQAARKTAVVTTNAMTVKVETSRHPCGHPTVL